MREIKTLVEAYSNITGRDVTQKVQHSDSFYMCTFLTSKMKNFPAKICFAVYSNRFGSFSHCTVQ